MLPAPPRPVRIWDGRGVGGVFERALGGGTRMMLPAPPRPVCVYVFVEVDFDGVGSVRL
jgi:hypothetical protein